MRAFSAGTLAGSGSFRCQTCGFGLALQELDQLPVCPHCGGKSFTRSSLFAEQTAIEPSIEEAPRPSWLEETRGALAEGCYLAFEEGEGVRTVRLADGWMRIGRSLAADIRFDDPTVSRRHALIHQEQNSARILDDRSLNGLFVNGERVDWHVLEDGDEVTIGRYRLFFVTGAGGEDNALRGEAESAVG